MSRIKPLSRADAPAEIVERYDTVFGAGRDPVAQPGTPTGTPGDWWTTWARVPGILNAFSGYSMATAPLDPKLREIALIRTGYIKQSQFVFSQHCKAGRRNGLADDKIQAIPYWQVSDVFTPLERSVLAYVDGMMLESGRVHDKVFAILKKHLSDEDILALTYFVNMYSLHATTTRALRLEYDNVAERVVEIPTPAPK